jgi:DHA2 family multidrug resistance protein-like MFS transporter
VTSYSVGAAIGPLAGGAVLEVLPWGSVLLLGVPVMALLLLTGPRLLPEQRELRRQPLDLPSAALSLGAVLAAIYGLKRIAADGEVATSLPWLLAGATLGWAFVRRQGRLDEPLLDLRLFRNPAFSVALGVNLLAFFVILGMSLFLAQYLQSVLGLSPLAAGLWTVPEALGFIAGAMLAPRLAARWRGQALIAAGMAIGAIGYLVVASTDDALAPLVAGSTIGAVGVAIVITLVTDLAVGAAAPEHAGAASATAETSSELGGALGIAILGSIGAAVFRNGVGDAVPAGTPGSAGETIGGALAAAHALPPQAGEGLVLAAREAFGDALMITASVGAATLVAGALAALALLRSTRRAEAAARAAFGPAA